MTKKDVDFAEHLSVNVLTPPMGAGIGYFMTIVFILLIGVILWSAFANNDGEIESK